VVVSRDFEDCLPENRVATTERHRRASGERVRSTARRDAEECRDVVAGEEELPEGESRAGSRPRPRAAECAENIAVEGAIESRSRGEHQIVVFRVPGEEERADLLA
jgi:hypothetical protein